MKESAAWVPVYPITALTQLFVLQGLNCLQAQVLKCQPRQQTITFIPRLYLGCHNKYNTLSKELPLSKNTWNTVTNLFHYCLASTSWQTQYTSSSLCLYGSSWLISRFVVVVVVVVFSQPTPSMGLCDTQERFEMSKAVMFSLEQWRIKQEAPAWITPECGIGADRRPRRGCLHE